MSRQSISKFILEFYLLDNLVYKRSEETWTLELIKIHSYNVLVHLDQMYMYNSLETSKLMNFFDLLFFGFVWEWLRLSGNDIFWWYLIFFFFVFCYLKSLVKKRQTFLGQVRRRSQADCQDFILAFADPQLWENYWNAGKSLEPHCVQKVFELWQWGAMGCVLLHRREWQQGLFCLHRQMSSCPGDRLILAIAFSPPDQPGFVLLFLLWFKL